MPAPARSDVRNTAVIFQERREWPSAADVILKAEVTGFTALWNTEVALRIRWFVLCGLSRSAAVAGCSGEGTRPASRSELVLSRAMTFIVFCRFAGPQLGDSRYCYVAFTLSRLDVISTNGFFWSWLPHLEVTGN